MFEMLPTTGNHTEINEINTFQQSTKVDKASACQLNARPYGRFGYNVYLAKTPQ